MSLLEESPVYCVGLNHLTAPVELLEQVTICRDELALQARAALEQQFPGAELEMVTLSTCNRFELYWAHTPSRGRKFHITNKQLEVLAGLVLPDASGNGAGAPPVYHFSGTAAWTHLFRVSSGLDSAVLGESEIQGQVAAAFSTAQAAGTVGPITSELFQSALRCGKRARAHTAVGRNAASVSSVAVQLAGRLVGNLEDACAVVVGAGQTGELTLKALVQRGLKQIHVVNRTLENAVRVASQWGGTAHAFSEFEQLLEPADILITAVTTPEPLLTRRMLEPVMAHRRERPLVIIDIAVPRNVSSDVADVVGVHLFDVDAVKATVEENARERQQEVPLVERIIDEELAGADGRLGELLVRPALTALWRRADAIRLEVLERTKRETPDMSAENWQAVERLATSLMKRILHTPAKKLRDEANDARAASHTEALEYLFELLPEESEVDRTSQYESI